MDKLRDDDRILLYWQAGKGNFSWLVERKEQLFLFTVVNMSRLTFQHWAFESYRQVDTISGVFRGMGFIEHPIYADYRHAKTMPEVQLLIGDIDNFEKAMKPIIEKQKAEYEAMLKAEKEAKQKSEQEQVKGDNVKEIQRII